MSTLFNRIILVAAYLYLVACVSGAKVKNVNYTVEEIRIAVAKISTSIRKGGGNERSFETNYFSRRAVKNFDPARAKERAYARFTVFGDRRPYQILVEVIIESRSGVGFKESGKDRGLANQIALDLSSALTKSREDRNAIDSFKAF